jgi:hypothetical protein
MLWIENCANKTLRAVLWVDVLVEKTIRQSGGCGHLLRREE